MRTRLNNPDYLKFPFSIGKNGAAASTRQQHIKEQVEQLLLTNPGERWYRPDFGVGVKALVFEPNNQPLWELTKNNLLAMLADTLQGEVLPETLQVDVEGEDSKLIIVISYQLAALQHTEQLRLLVPGGL